MSEYLGDGVDPSFVKDKKLSELFRDWEEQESGSLASCGPAPTFECPQLRYCDRRDLKCHHNVPVVISPALLEIFNKQYAPSRGLPVLGADIQAFIRGPRFGEDAPVLHAR